LIEVSMSKQGDRATDSFDAEAALAQPGIIREFASYLRHNRKWWLAPIIIALLLVGGLLIVGGTAAAPIIYTLF
jgi:hypothetical protein